MEKSDPQVSRILSHRDHVRLNMHVKSRAGRTLSRVAVVLLAVGIALPLPARASVEKEQVSATQENVIESSVKRVIETPVGILWFVIGGVQKIISPVASVLNQEAGRVLSEDGGNNMEEGIKDVVTGGMIVGGFALGGPAGAVGGLVLVDRVITTSSREDLNQQIEESLQNITQQQETISEEPLAAETGIILPLIQITEREVELPYDDKFDNADKSQEVSTSSITMGDYPPKRRITNIGSQSTRESSVAEKGDTTPALIPPKEKPAKIHSSIQSKEAEKVSSVILDEKEARKVVEEALSLATIIGSKDKYIELAGGVWSAMNADNVRKAIEKRLNPSYEESISEGPFAGQEISFIEQMRKGRETLVTWQRQIESGEAYPRDEFVLAMKQLALALQEKQKKAEEKFGKYFSREQRPETLVLFFAEFERAISTAQALSETKIKSHFAQVQ